MLCNRELRPWWHSLWQELQVAGDRKREIPSHTRPLFDDEPLPLSLLIVIRRVLDTPTGQGVLEREAVLARDASDRSGPETAFLGAGTQC